MAVDNVSKALIANEWDKVTKPILHKLEELGVDAPITCSQLSNYRKEEVEDIED